MQVPVESKTNINCCHCPWFPAITRQQDPTADDTAHFQCRIQINQPATDQVMPFLLTSLYSARYGMQGAGTKILLWSYPVLDHVAYSTDMLIRHTHCFNSGMMVLMVTNHILIVSKSCPIKVHAFKL